MSAQVREMCTVHGLSKNVQTACTFQALVRSARIDYTIRVHGILTGESLPGPGHPEHALLAYRLFAKAAHGHDGHQEIDENTDGHEYKGDLPRGRKHGRIRGQSFYGERTAMLVAVDLFTPVVNAHRRTTVDFVIRVCVVIRYRETDKI